MSYDCGKLKSDTRENWDARHAAHGTPVKQYPEQQPPSYRLVQYVCPCGSMYVDMEPKP